MSEKKWCPMASGSGSTTEDCVHGKCQWWLDGDCCVVQIAKGMIGALQAETITKQVIDIASILGEGEPK